MKVAIVKQVLDTFGPWSSVRWEETSPESLLTIWPGKPLYWEMTTLFRADWYIVPQQINTDYTYDSVLKHRANAGILRKYTRGVVATKEIPFEAYDLVIANDPVLSCPRNASTLFAYFLVEHWDRRYRKSLRRPVRNADLFLAHMMDAPFSIARLPQAVSFPYVRDPKTARALFGASQREEAAWTDWRTLSFLCAGKNGNVLEASRAAAERLQDALRLPVRFRSFSMGLYHGEDPPRWGDAAEFLRELGRQKYYLCLGRNSGAGQGLADAASLGCLCFGERDKPYHRLLCHPEALCGDLQELPKRLARVRASWGLQEEIAHWQDAKLQQHFIDAPVALLHDALERRRHASPITAKHFTAACAKPSAQTESNARVFPRSAP